MAPQLAQLAALHKTRALAGEERAGAKQSQGAEPGRVGWARRRDPSRSARAARAGALPERLSAPQLARALQLACRRAAANQPTSQAAGKQLAKGHLPRESFLKATHPGVFLPKATYPGVFLSSATCPGAFLSSVTCHRSLF